MKVERAKVSDAMNSLRQIESFYSKRNVFITGHTGFVGAWMTLWLSRIGANVTGYSLNPPSDPYLYDMLELDGVDSIRGDIRNKEKLKKAVKSANPDVIIHLAAQAILLESYKIPIETYETNVVGTANLLEAAMNSGTKSVLSVTSDKCYENKSQRKGYKEDDKLGGHDPYSSSKACAEMVTAAYRDSFFDNMGIALSTARAGNIIGGGDWGRYRLVPALARSTAKGARVDVRNPNAVRPWQYVLDVVHGYLLLAEKGSGAPKRYSGAWNFGPSTSSVRTVMQFIDAFAKAWGADAKINITEPKLHEDKLLMLDPSKAKKKLGWSSRVGFEDTIRLTAGWYKRYYNKDNMHDYSCTLLNKYTSME